MEGNVCINCFQDCTPLVIIDEHRISICSNCGTVYILEKGLILDIPIEMDNTLYTVYRGLAEIYKLYQGDVRNAPSIEDH